MRLYLKLLYGMRIEVNVIGVAQNSYITKYRMGRPSRPDGRKITIHVLPTEYIMQLMIHLDPLHHFRQQKLYIYIYIFYFYIFLILCENSLGLHISSF
jgi:hypothetical protein